MNYKRSKSLLIKTKIKNVKQIIFYNYSLFYENSPLKILKYLKMKIKIYHY